MEPQDTVNILFSSYNNNQLFDVEIILDECDISLLPEGYCDCSGNIFDECGICNGDNDCFPDFVNLVNVYPNPFSEFLNVAYELPEQTNVKISIFDINGSLIDILFNESQYGSQNPYKFNWNPNILPSGVYILNFETKFKSVSEKITLLK